MINLALSDELVNTYLFKAYLEKDGDKLLSFWCDFYCTLYSNFVYYVSTGHESSIELRRTVSEDITIAIASIDRFLAIVVLYPNSEIKKMFGVTCKSRL